MKKSSAILISLILLAVIAGASFAKPIDANLNLALNKTAYGTFGYLNFASDGKTRGVAATSGDISDTPQYLTIDLGSNIYLDRAKIYFDKTAYSNNFSVKTSPDAKYWYEEASNIDAATGIVDDASGTIALSVSLKRAVISSRYLQVYIPAGTKVTNSKGNYVKITEVEVFPAVNQKLTIDQAGDYLVTNNLAVIKYKTSIGVSSGGVQYGTAPEKLDMIAINAISGVDNNVVLGGLKANTTYYYQVKATDYYGNSSASTIKTFTTTSGDNVALKKPVSGTFVNLPPNDTYVKAGSDTEILSRVTDGGTSYFTSMATSGNLNNADQYVVIDLGKPFTLKSIVSYWRKLAYPEELTVQVSNDNSTWTTIAEKVDAGTGAFSRSDAGDPMQLIKVPGQSARYIKLLVKKGSSFYHKHSQWNFVQLMEVAAYTE